MNQQMVQWLKQSLCSKKPGFNSLLSHIKNFKNDIYRFPTLVLGSKDDVKSKVKFLGQD